jgi:hypothetical protein
VSCRVTGIDANESGVATATLSVPNSKQADRVTFEVADRQFPIAFR